MYWSPWLVAHHACNHVQDAGRARAHADRTHSTATDLPASCGKAYREGC